MNSVLLIASVLVPSAGRLPPVVGISDASCDTRDSCSVRCHGAPCHGALCHGVRSHRVRCLGYTFEVKRSGPQFFMGQHEPYVAPSTYYYFRPYNFAHVFPQQTVAGTWVTHPGRPYSNAIFKSVYQQIEPEALVPAEPMGLPAP